jgi:crotonobetainyl-CoA:carnitine CoA-transferase CaiB-like acyl-CoA transferase
MTGYTTEVKMAALDGVKVVDLSRLLPGPFCTALLADHGADVVVVEAPRFRNDPVLGHVPMVMRNKRHMSVDLKTDKGREVFFKLVSTADVLVEGFRPGVAERLGVGQEAVRRANTRIIYCSLTGYGQDGPLATKAGHDLNYMAAAGMLDLIRDKDGTPIMPNFQMADLSGSLYAALGILLAVVARERTGKGQYVDVSMTDGLLSLLAVPLSFTFDSKRFPGRPDNDSPEWFACYRVYRTRDGEYLSVGPLEPHLWESLCEKLGCPRFTALQYEREKQGEIIAHLEQLFASRDLKDWLELLCDPDDCVAPVTRMRDLPDDPHLVARLMIHQSSLGIPEPGITPKLSGTPGQFRRPAYVFGEHTREVLAELGYDENQILRMEEDSVVWSQNGE